MTDNNNTLTPTQGRRANALELAHRLAPSEAEVWGYVDFILRGIRPAPATADVFLTGVGEKKIPVIKAIREIQGCGLKEAKDLVDAAEQGMPQVALAKATAEQSKAAKRLLVDAGATVVIRSA